MVLLFEKTEIMVRRLGKLVLREGSSSATRYGWDDEESSLMAASSLNTQAILGHPCSPNNFCSDSLVVALAVS